MENELLKSQPVIDVYQPPDGEFNYWMIAMIGVGCAFVVFVIGSVHLMCNSPAGNQPLPLRRHPSQNKTLRSTERDHL